MKRAITVAHSLITPEMCTNFFRNFVGRLKKCSFVDGKYFEFIPEKMLYTQDGAELEHFSDHDTESD